MIEKLKKKFKCRRCAECCKVAGYVNVPGKQVSSIAKYLGITKKDFRKKYTRSVSGRIVLKGTFRGSCPFLEGSRCAIYPVRPEQCRTFPFWPELIKDKKEWKWISKHCPASREISYQVHPSEIKRSR